MQGFIFFKCFLFSSPTGQPAATDVNLWQQISFQAGACAIRQHHRLNPWGARPPPGLGEKGTAMEPGKAGGGARGKASMSHEFQYEHFDILIMCMFVSIFIFIYIFICTLWIRRYVLWKLKQGCPYVQYLYFFTWLYRLSGISHRALCLCAVPNHIFMYRHLHNAQENRYRQRSAQDLHVSRLNWRLIQDFLP